MRAIRVLAAFGIALVLATPAALAKPRFSPLGDELIPEDGFALQGDVAIVVRGGDGWELWEHDLSKGSKKVLTSIPYGVGTRVTDLRVDGDWVAWSDDRTGDFEVYALSRSTGGLLRVTDATGADGGVSLYDGLIGWLSFGALHVANLPGLEPVDYEPGGMPLDNSVFDGGVIASWLDGGERSLFHLAPGEAPRLLHRVRGTFPGEVRTDGHSVAWLTKVLWDPDEPGLGFKGSVVQAMPSGGNVTNLTLFPVKATSLSVDGGQVCWLQRDDRMRLRCHDLASGNDRVVDLDATDAKVSPAHILAYSPAGSTRWGTLMAANWGGGPSKGAPFLDAPLVALGVMALARARLR